MSKQAIIVKRGDCTFVDKTRNAQKLGYDLVIVYIQNESWPMKITANIDTKDITITTIAIKSDDA